MHEISVPYLRELVLFLAVSALVVWGSRRLRLSPILGFLVAGAAIGPEGLARAPVAALRLFAIDDVDTVRSLAELGILLLMFEIGLELAPARLWSVRRMVLGLGGAQVLVSAAVLAPAALAFGVSPAGAVLLGASMALSSTAVVMQILHEQRRVATQLGRAVFAVLLMQDLAVVPILILGGALGALGGESAWAAVGATLAEAIVVLAVLGVAGRFLVHRVFRSIAARGLPELFTGVTLLWAVGMGMITAAAGLSLALGAFLAGLLLAESEYRHEIVAEVEPFRGLLLGLFFMSVGMTLDLGVLADGIAGLAAAAVALYAVKALVAGALARAFGLPRHAAAEAGLLLGQAGEFTFVVIGLAAAERLVAGPTVSRAAAVVALSMLATPPFALLGRWIGRRGPGAAASDLASLEGHVILAGFGRVGRGIARVLDAEAVPYVALDLDGLAVARRRRRGEPVYFGDARRGEVLRRLNPEKARALLVTLDDPPAAEAVVAAVRREWPSLPLLARARDARHASRLLGLGAQHVVCEDVEATLQLSGRLLETLGLRAEAVAERLVDARERARSEVADGGG